MPYVIRTSHILLLPLLVAGVLLAGCDTTEPEDDAGEGELITRVVLSLTEAGASTRTITVTAEDSNGDTVIDNIQTLTLTAGQTYTGSVALYNDLEDPPENITEEVEEEDYAHQFQYTVTGATGVTVSDRDLDRNNLPLGLTFTLTVAGDATASGGAALRVVLRHYDEAAPDNPTPKQNDAGETDVQVDFPLVITD